MQTLSATVTEGFKSAFRDYAQRVRTLAASVTAEQFWRKPYSYGNSMGHLTLHLIGNLNYYLGAQIAQTGYVRDREREFTDQNPPAKEDTVQQFEATIEMVLAMLDRQGEDGWMQSYSAVGVVEADRFGIILRCAAHCHHHIGQMIYLAKEHNQPQ